MRAQHHSCGTHPLDTGLQEGEIGDTYIGKGMMLMLHLHARDAREPTPCPLVSLQCARRFDKFYGSEVREVDLASPHAWHCPISS